MLLPPLLPLHHAPPPADDPVDGPGAGPLPGHPADAAGRALGPARVLVVEDEWLVSMDIEAALADAGHEVVAVATSAAEAVRLAEMHRPELVLMDIRLKGDRDGIDAAGEILQRHGIRSLFVTAHTDIGTTERAAACAPLGWLSKPFSAHQLVAAVAAALKGREGAG